jgi:hypothetical protein
MGRKLAMFQWGEKGGAWGRLGEILRIFPWELGDFGRFLAGFCLVRWFFIS